MYQFTNGLINLFSFLPSLTMLRIDLAVLLGKSPSSVEHESPSTDASQAPALNQPLVFSNSKQSAIAQPTAGNTFSHHGMVNKGWGFSLLGLECGGVCLWVHT